MIAATQEQQQQQQAAGTAPSAEEEALKRNTDCVYFLASPLTCKKGSECEYRHSEYARVNPRDCYFWLNGNCLNPKCGFRHPPLDGLFGTQVSSAAGSSLPPSNVAAPPAMHAPQNTGKQAVPCIFFQKGLCLKGDRCAFLHGPNPTSSNKVIATSSTEPPPPKKPSTGPQKLTHEQKTVQRNFSKAAEVPTEAKPVSKPEIVQPRNVLGVERNPPLSKSIDDELPMHKATNLAPVANGNASHFNRFQQTQLPEDHVFQNGKDSDEFLRESSPGFDVLVDDELRNSDYPHGEDQYRRRGHEGRNLNPGDEYDAGLSADYSSVADMEQETYHDLQGYDTYDHMQGHYAWEQHKTSSERMLSGSARIERRGYSKLDTPESIDESDLRYRLSKHRRVNGLRSVVSHDFVSDNPVDERGYRGSSRRDSHNLSSHENAASSRLRGRIKLPGRPPSGSDLRVEREIDWGRNRARVSPGRSPVPSHQARIRDRVKARVEEDYINEGRHCRGARMREMTNDRGTDFEGPKSLAELKGTKSIEDDQTQPSLRKRKQLEDHLPFEGNLSFKGPMPLSEILKRKREAEGAASGVVTSLRSKEDNHLKDGKESLLGSSNTVSETKDSHMSTTEESDKQVPKDEKLKSQIAGAVGIAEENSEVVPLQYSSEQRNPSEPETEDGVMVDDGMEDRKHEGDEQREGDYEYDQVDEGEYYEEGEENPEGGEEEYVDEEDGEDFAKKIGVLFS